MGTRILEKVAQEVEKMWTGNYREQLLVLRFDEYDSDIVHAYKISRLDHLWYVGSMNIEMMPEEVAENVGREATTIVRMIHVQTFEDKYMEKT